MHVEVENYINCDESWLRALTRERRQQSREGNLPSWVYGRLNRVEPVRYSCCAEAVEFETVVACVPLSKLRRKGAASAYRRRLWRAGVRACFYCREEMSPNMGHPMKVTVDHRQPLALGGRDDETNWALACLRCNARKGIMTEAEFRALIAVAIAAE